MRAHTPCSATHCSSKSIMGVARRHGELKVVVATGPGTFSKDEQSRYPSQRPTETGRLDSWPSSTRVIDREFPFSRRGFFSVGPFVSRDCLRPRLWPPMLLLLLPRHLLVALPPRISTTRDLVASCTPSKDVPLVYLPGNDGGGAGK